MPTLHWIGKDKVINHHLDVPYRVLDHKYGFDKGSQISEETKSGNKIIHGDNLEALKSLLPEYEGKIKCIYIDPPYNTGNEGWVYNDNVNDPKIKKWLHAVVGKEGEDLSRHDKWLCMMYPRLKLLHKLLSHDGVIFVSINDIEQANLKLMMDEIFGLNRFITQFIWKSRQNKDNRNINRVSVDHEYILCYGTKLNGLERDNNNYSNPDNDQRGAWTSANMVGLLDERQRPNLHYDLIDHRNGINYGKPKMGWRYEPDTMTRLINEDRIIFPKSKEGRPRRKVFISELSSDVTGFSSIVGKEIYTRDGTNLIQELFDGRAFDFPKPTKLIEELIEQATSEDDIVLDSFAGSGTTAHAVLNINKNNNRNLKFITIEMENYAEHITAERIKKVISGYGQIEGTADSFDFYLLGEHLFKETGELNEEVGIQKLRTYIFYTETNLSLTKSIFVDNEYHLDIFNQTSYYFYYKKDDLTSLDDEFLSTINNKAEQYIIYADNCLLNSDYMKKQNIIFKKIPRDISKF
jgi:adenine-specific DNA-methyltransferase